MEGIFKRFKLISSILIVLILIQTSISIFSYKNYAAEEEDSNVWDISETEDDNVTATLDEEGTLTISGEGRMRGREIEYNNNDSLIEFPEYKYLPWYEKRIEIKKVVIQEGVTNVSNYSFYNCDNISEVVLSDTITEIGDFAFYNCAQLKNINIPEGVKIIGEEAFSQCYNLQSIDLPSSLENIMLTQYDKYLSIFRNCLSLEEVNVSENNSNYSSEDGILYNKDKTVIMYYPEGKKDKTYVVPSTVTSIYLGCFSNYLETLEISSNVSEIQSSINSVNISINNIENIIVDEDDTNYSSNKGVLFNKDGTELLVYPSGKKDTYYKLPEGVKKIASGAFESNKYLKEIDLDNGTLEELDECVIFNMELEEINIPATVKSMGAAFQMANIKKMSVDPDNEKYYSENDVIYDKDTKQVIAKTYLTKDFEPIDVSEAQDGSIIASIDEEGTLIISGEGRIKDDVKIEEKVKNVVIEDGITYIGNNLLVMKRIFKDYPIIDTVYLGKSVEEIGREAFLNQRVKAYEVSEDNQYFSDIDGVLTNKEQTELIKYPNGGYGEEYIVPSKITKIKSYAFEKYRETNDKNSTKIYISDSVKEIEEGAFCSIFYYQLIYTTMYDFQYNRSVICCKSGSIAEEFAKNDGTVGYILDDEAPQLSIEYVDAENTETEESVEEKIWNFFIEKGYSEYAVAGLMGNLSQESGLDPTIVSTNGSIGICQWNYERKTQLENYANVMGKDATDLDIQLEFLNMELLGNSEYAIDGFMGNTEAKEKWINATNVEEATSQFCEGFSRPGNPLMEERIKKAESFYEVYGNQVSLVADQGESLGQYRIRTYCYECNDDGNGNFGTAITESGKIAAVNRTVAVNADGDSNGLKIGDSIMINGQVYIVEDLSNGVEGEDGNFINIYVYPDECGSDDYPDYAEVFIADNVREVSSEEPESQANAIRAVITANEPIRLPDGWNYVEGSNDRIYKDYVSEDSLKIDEDIVVEDLVGNKSTINVKIGEEEEEKDENVGDLNDDGVIDITDYTIFLRHYDATKNENVLEKHPDWKLQESKEWKLDVDKNGIVDITDASKILRHFDATKNEDVLAKHPDWIIILSAD